MRIYFQETTRRLLLVKNNNYVNNVSQLVYLGIRYRPISFAKVVYSSEAHNMTDKNTMHTSGAQDTVNRNPQKLECGGFRVEIQNVG
jgi:hypothetical protein